MSIVVSKPTKPGNATGPMAPLAPLLTSTQGQAQVSPWIDAQKDESGRWHLPEYSCEVRGLAPDDPKNVTWRPGDYIPAVDNVDHDKNNVVREWGGQKMWEGDRPPREWNPNRLPPHMQAVLQVPHMPGQPMKEMFARMKALDPKQFEDRYYSDILRNLPEAWPRLARRIRWAESFGLNTEAEPAEWAGQEEMLLPAAYLTPRPDTVSICAGMAGQGGSSSSLKNSPGTEYDYLELLYAKDQEGRLIQVVPFESCGATPSVFWTFSFVPPRGTTSITPYASFKFRGVWRGDDIEWDPSVGSEEMDWFSKLDGDKLRQLSLPDPDRQPAKVKAEKLPKRVKEVPVLWPENSWQGNAAKARMWDEMPKS